MSKSLGNGVDPIDVVGKYGADSLRYFITTNSSPGQDLRYDEEKVESSWNFINKLWNISRYVVMNTEELKPEDIVLNKAEMEFPEKWILTKLNNMLEQANAFFDKFEFGEAAKLSDRLQTNVVLVYVLNQIIKLLHPFMPFVTEEIFQKLPNKEISIMVSDWPEASDFTFNETKDKDWFFELIRRIRTIRNDYQVPWSKPVDMLIQTNETDKAFLEENDQYFIKFLNPKKLEIKENIENVENAISIILANLQVYIPLGELVNIEEEIKNIENEIKRLEGEIKRCQGMLNNPKFVDKAPEAKVNEEREKLVKYENNLKEANQRLLEIKG
jgi:valyl-tRNA synthetase